MELSRARLRNYKLREDVMKKGNIVQWLFIFPEVGVLLKLFSLLPPK